MIHSITNLLYHITNKRSNIIYLSLFLLPLFLVVASYTYAQVGGVFDLTWSTIDNGGGRSTGDIFELEGTIGQFDANPIATGGAFTLQGGFWGATCAVPTAVSSPSIIINSTQVQLNWSAVLGANNYDIYRVSNEPYFSPAVVYGTAGSGFWLDPDTASIADLTNNYTYIIRATNGCGDAPDSQRIGQFDFLIIPGS